MNLYILVEGKQTEQQVYPEWLKHLSPKLERVKQYDLVNSNQYYLFSGNGYPSLLNHIENSIKDVNNHKVFDYFIIVLDADDYSVDERKSEILNYIHRNNIVLNERVKLKIIVQNKCIESWFLANNKIFKKNPQDSELVKYIKHYDVSKHDPELMPKKQDYYGSVAHYHYKYLTLLFAEKQLRYTKNNPGEVMKSNYLTEIIRRSTKTGHLNSFTDFVDLCGEINSQIDSH